MRIPVRMVTQATAGAEYAGTAAVVGGMTHDLDVTFRALPGRGAELERLLLDAVREIGDVPCLERLLIERAPEEPDVVRVTESWTSRAEHEEFAARPDVRALIAGVHELCERPPEIVRSSRLETPAQM